MAIVVPDSAERNVLKIILGIDTQPSSVFYHLFTNNLTLSETSVLGDFTELSGSLYDPLEVASGDWTVSTASGITTAVRAMYSWSITDSATLYGYFVTDSGGTVLYWAEKFTSSISIPSGGGTVNFTARIALD